MELDMFLVTVYCLVDDMVKQILAEKRMRTRGFSPTLSDSEVLTMEVVGEFIGLARDKAIFEYFRRHYSSFFPEMTHIHRTTFIRQAANLYALKGMLWQQLLKKISILNDVGMIDSFPIHVCQFARAVSHRRFRGHATYGRDELIRQTFYGFRCHLTVHWPGIITRVDLAPGNVADRNLIPEMAEGHKGWILGDIAYHQPQHQELLHHQGLDLLTPGHQRHRNPLWTHKLTGIRRRIETVIGQLVEHFQAKKVWAQDLWHLSSRILRKVLSHTMAVFINQTYKMTPSPLQIRSLVT